MSKWNYTNHKNFTFLAPEGFLDEHKRFQSDWLEVDPQVGIIFIPKGYSWDGCSPKIGPIGTPDGWTLKNGYRVTGRASMLHDALYQYMGQHSLTRKECDELFAEQLKRDRFPFWWLYYGAVRAFGGIFNKLSKDT